MRETLEDKFICYGAITTAHNETGHRDMRLHIRIAGVLKNLSGGEASFRNNLNYVPRSEGLFGRSARLKPEQKALKYNRSAWIKHCTKRSSTKGPT